MDISTVALNCAKEYSLTKSPQDAETAYATGFQSGYNLCKEQTLKAEPTKEEISEAKNLLGENKALIEAHFGAVEDALTWFHNCDIKNMAVIINDLINKFKQ